MSSFDPEQLCQDGKIGTLEHSLANYNHDYTVATGKEPPVSEDMAMLMVLFGDFVALLNSDKTAF